MTEETKQKLEDVANKIPDVSEEQAAEMARITAEREAIVKKISGQKFTDSIITIVQRAEMHSKLYGKDYYITMVENGIAFFSEENYDKQIEQTVNDLKAYLTNKNIDEAQQATEIDTYIANLTIHYVDFKTFTDEEVQYTRERFGVPGEEKEEK